MDRWDELQQWIRKVRNKRLREALEKFFDRHREEFENYPASLYHHCNYRGGLLDHTLNVVELAVKIAHIVGYIDLENVIVAALLHDVGKLQDYIEVDGEFKDNPFRWASHEVSGLQMFQEETGYVLPTYIARAILSHMGGWSRSSVYPNDLLSAIIHAADLLSSRLETVEVRE